MSTLDEITKEKQRLGEALARVDGQREKLSSQLSELEAPDTNGLAASKSATGNSTPNSRPGPNNAPRSDPGQKASAARAPK